MNNTELDLKLLEVLERLTQILQELTVTWQITVTSSMIQEWVRELLQKRRFKGLELEHAIVTVLWRLKLTEWGYLLDDWPPKAKRPPRRPRPKS